MGSRLNKFIYKTLLFTLPVLVIFEALFRLGFFPVITTSTFFDNKMMKVQKLHLKNVQLMAMGSSITLYELKGNIITKNFKMPYYNFASWGLNIADMRALLKGFVNEYNPKYVIICSAPGDFKMPLDSSYLSFVNASEFIKRGLPELFYFKNYSSVYRIMHREYFGTSTQLDNWGGASLTVNKKDIKPKAWNMQEKFPTEYTRSNYNELDSLAALLNQRGVKLIFIQAPMKKPTADTAKYQQIMAAHFNQCRIITEKNNGVYLNYYNTTVFADSLFVDPYHLQDAGSVIFTNEVVAGLKTIIK